MLEAHDDVIGVAHDDDLTSGMALSPSVCPEVEDVMEIDIGQQWRGNRPLGRACLCGHKLSVFHHACLQPLADKAVYTTIADAVFNETHQPLVTDRIEESRDIGVHYPVYGSGANFKKGRRADPGALGERESLACQSGPKFKLCTRSENYGRSERLSVFLRKERSDRGARRLSNKVEKIIDAAIKKIYLTAERPDVAAVVEEVNLQCFNSKIKARSKHYSG